MNNNLDVGGIQKSIINLLKCVSKDYDVTLLLFSRTGPLIHDIPKNVKVITAGQAYRILGISRNELMKHPLLCIQKLCMKLVAKHLGKRKAIRILGIFKRKLEGYDVAISCSHLTNAHGIENGCAEFVLDKVIANKKACFVHCDYIKSKLSSSENNDIYRCYDDIICVSESVKNNFLKILPDLDAKTRTIRNFYDFDIENRASEANVIYDNEYINIALVARLSKEKGIERAIEALSLCNRKDIKLHIIGDGPLKKHLMQLCNETKVKDNVVFYGEQRNPYAYIKNADYILVSSFHEAAPIIFDEAHILSTPIISTKVLSSAELLNDCDIECENSMVGIRTVFEKLKKIEIKGKRHISNEESYRKFSEFLRESVNDSNENR